MSNKNLKATKEFFSAKNIATFGVLLALMIVLQLWGTAIPMFGLTINLALVPIALAGIFFGAFGGGLIGFVGGVIIFITCALMGREESTAYFFAHSPVILTLTCIGKTTVAGAVSGALYSLISKKNKIVASYVASIVIPVLNTGLYVLGILLMKKYAATYMGTEDTAGAVFVTLFGFIWLNFLLELITTVLLSPAVYTVVRVTEKRLTK